MLGLIKHGESRMHMAASLPPVNKQIRRGKVVFPLSFFFLLFRCWHVTSRFAMELANDVSLKKGGVVVCVYLNERCCCRLVA